MEEDPIPDTVVKGRFRSHSRLSRRLFLCSGRSPILLHLVVRRSFSFDRRFRIFDLSEYGERISTFKYTEKGEEIDLMDLLTPE